MINIFSSTELNNEADWDRVNDIAEELEKEHPTVRWTGSGTGFGCRDLDYEAPDEATATAFAEALTARLSEAGLTSSVKIDVDLED